MNTAALIPALDPDDTLVSLIKQLDAAGFEKIIVVNDGSGHESGKIFKQIKNIKKCVLLSHEENKGKGSALKTGLNYFAENCTDMLGVVTFDCDGQHSVRDAVTVAQLMSENRKALILGARDMEAKNVPKKCRNVNRVTKKLMESLYRKELIDTMSGLRGIPRKLVPLFAGLGGSRYDYETNMLIECFAKDIDIIQTPVDTVFDSASDSHYRAVRDTVRIYWPMCNRLVKFWISAFACYCIEFLIYVLLIKVPFSDMETGSVILAAQACSKVFSCAGNFMINKHTVFKKSGSSIECLVKYILVMILLVVASSTLISMAMEVFELKTDQTIFVKLIVDFFLMIVNFIIQRRWVFSDKHLIA